MGIYSVSEITKHIKVSMDNDQMLRSVLIRGEISNFKNHYSGHCYFTLKDKSSSIKTVMFKSKAQYLKFTPTDGMKVVAGGSITVFERDGQYQFYVNSLFPEGAGELSLAFAQLKEKLTAEGLFDALHKKKLPPFSKTIGIITSATGAVLRDIFTVAKRRNPKIALRLYPVQVQGGDSAQQIAAAIRFFNEKYPVDVLIVGRGGGSIEDLWSFNEEVVVRAIYDSAIPVVSAVGHETDYTLADFASDVRAATPSQAAELCVADAREIIRYIKMMEARLTGQVRRRLAEKRNCLAAYSNSRILRNPQLVLADKRQLLDSYIEKIGQLKNAALIDKQHRLNILLKKLQMLSPLDVLKRGYSIVKFEECILHQVAGVQKGQNLELILQDGSMDVVVTKVRKGQAKYGAFKK